MEKVEMPEILTKELMDSIVSNPEVMKVLIPREKDEIVIQGADIHMSCDPELLNLKSVFCNVHISNQECKCADKKCAIKIKDTNNKVEVSEEVGAYVNNTISLYKNRMLELEEELNKKGKLIEELRQALKIEIEKKAKMNNKGKNTAYFRNTKKINRNQI